MNFEDWLNNRWIIKEPTSRKEIRGLLSVVSRDLKQCGAPDLIPDWRLSIAYNAALQLAGLALRACGFRIPSSAGSHHYRTIQSLSFTLSLGPQLIKYLNAFRRKRNIAEYDRAGAVTSSEAAEMVALAFQLQDTVVNWLRDTHPNLLPGPPEEALGEEE